MAKEQFVPVAGDDWYQRRRQDDEGEFFRSVANQGPRKGQGGATRQGIYVFTAGGKLLAYRNHHDPDVMRSAIAQGLKAWNNLPEADRRPGAIQVGEPKKTDRNYSHVLPAGGIVVTSYTRILDKPKNGEFCVGTCNFRGGDQAARDHFWLREEEWKSLVPQNPKKGDSAQVSKRIVHRIARFHLLDNTRGEPSNWGREQIFAAEMKLTVDEATAATITLRLEGKFLLATAADVNKADRGFEARLLGYIRYNVAKKTLDRFDVVALGEHWGSGEYNPGARPGRTPLGIAFELARGDSPAEQVPPQGARYLRGYWNADTE